MKQVKQENYQQFGPRRQTENGKLMIEANHSGLCCTVPIHGITELPIMLHCRTGSLKSNVKHPEQKYSFLQIQFTCKQIIVRASSLI